MIHDSGDLNDQCNDVVGRVVFCSMVFFFFLSWTLFYVNHKFSRPRRSGFVVSERVNTKATLRLVLVRHPETRRDLLGVSAGELCEEDEPTCYGWDMFDAILKAVQDGNYAAGGRSLKQNTGVCDRVKVRDPIFAGAWGPLSLTDDDDGTAPFLQELVAMADDDCLKFDRDFTISRESIAARFEGLKDGVVQPMIVFCSDISVYKLLFAATDIDATHAPVLLPGSATVIDVVRDTARLKTKCRAPHTRWIYRYIPHRVCDMSICMPPSALHTTPAFPHNNPATIEARKEFRRLR